MNNRKRKNCTKDIITISLDSDEDEDPLRLSPPPPPPPAKNSIVIPNVIGNRPRALERMSNNNTGNIRRILPVTIKKVPTVNIVSSLRPNNTRVNGSALVASEQEATAEKQFETFLRMCYNLDPGKDTETIINKTRNHFKKADRGYRTDPSFLMLLAGKTASIKSNPREMFSHLSEVHQEIKMRRLKPNQTRTDEPQPSTSRAVEEPDEERDEEEEEDVANKDPAFLYKLKRLQTAAQSLKKKIAKLEEKEVDWDDDGDSTYMRLQAYRKRAFEVHTTLCKYTGERLQRNQPRVLCHTDYPQINAAVDTFLRRTKQFPDYRDILNVIEKSSKDEGLNLPPAKEKSIALKVFEFVGDQLQRHRQMDEWNDICGVLGSNRDPAEVDAELAAKLAENRAKGKAKLDQVISSFVKKQDDEKLQPVEVLEEEANCSEGSDSEEEEEEEDSRQLKEEYSDDDMFVTDLLDSDVDLCDNVRDEALSPSPPSRDDSPFLNEETGLIEYPGLSTPSSDELAEVAVDSLDGVTSSQGNDSATKFVAVRVNKQSDEPTQSELITSSNLEATLVASPKSVVTKSTDSPITLSEPSSPIPEPTDSEISLSGLKRKLDPIADLACENKIPKLASPINEPTDSFETCETLRKVIVPLLDESIAVSAALTMMKNPKFHSKHSETVIKSKAIGTVPSAEKMSDLDVDIVPVIDVIDVTKSESLITTSVESTVQSKRNNSTTRTIRVSTFESSNFSKRPNVLKQLNLEVDCITIDD